MEQKLYPEINRVVATESGLVQGVPGNTPQYTVFMKSLTRQRAAISRPSTTLEPCLTVIS